MGSLMLNGINYSGGEGSAVEPNPAGTPTATLNKLGIGGTIYGIEGTTLILDAQIYSTEERVVGVWFDNKPLYSRVFDLGSDVQVSYDSFTDTSIDASDMEKVADAKGFYSTGATAYNVMANINNNIIRLQTDRNGVVANIRYVLLFYTRTTDTAGSGGYQAYGFSPIIYSTEEREVGVWKDNKPLYAKTVNITAYPSNTTAVDIPHGIADIDTVAHYEAHARWASGAMVVIPNAQVNNGSIIDSASFDCTVNKTNITLRVGTDRSAVSGEVTILYTKTTDTAGSGSYNTLGVPMVHFDSTEQVVGTWEDENGVIQTVYERRFITNVSDDSIHILDANMTKDAIELLPTSSIMVKTGSSHDSYFATQISSSQFGRLFSNINGLGVSVEGYSSSFGTVKVMAVARYYKKSSS